MADLAEAVELLPCQRRLDPLVEYLSQTYISLKIEDQCMNLEVEACHHRW